MAYRSVSRLRLCAAALSVLATTAFPGPALAIPSPELVVGSITSLSQLLALVTALLGGGAIAAGRKIGGRNAATPVWQQRLTLGALGLMVVTIALNVYQYVDRANERQTRLEETLARPSRAPHEPAADPNLKEVPFPRQVNHPQGINTDDAADIIARVADGKAPDTLLIDIRETAEVESGSIPHTRPIRFPDLPTAGLDLAGKRVLMFCHNGNRSAETCEALAKRGIDCRFMIGGMEKWLTEGRSLEGSQARSLGELRAIPDYRNDKTLLLTPDVKRMVAEEGAIFVDVRYPGEFERTHLTDAINLPMRPLPTVELRRRLDELPQKPVIAPCYDRRSCFFAEILGLELNRGGRDYRGRYTTPWEYFVPQPPPPHVVAWQAEQSVSTWTRTAEALSGVLNRSAAMIGLPLSVILLAALSRLLVLPFSLKAERDQLTTERVKDEFAVLRGRLAADPSRLARATQAFYRRHGLTPIRNLVALLFLPVLAIAMEATRLAAAAVPASVLWIDDLSLRDPTLLLPILLAVLITFYIHLCFGRTPRSKLLIWLLGLPAFTATGAALSAAADLYILASAALLLAQRFFVVGGPARVARTARRILAPRRIDGAVPFSLPQQLTGAGNKAYRLARLKSVGLAVPDGLVLTSDYLSRFETAATDERKRMGDRLWRRMGRTPLAVRSSAASEDGAGASFAGVFESIIDVERGCLPEAIEKVQASFRSVRAKAYALGSGSENVLLQPMVKAEISGVMFTRDPQAPGVTMIETVAGALDQLVSGRAAPQVFRYGRITGTRVGADAPPVDLAPLLALGRRVEQEFAAPQDIEWAFARGRFVILQSRDITSMQGGADDVVAQEWARLESVAANPGPARRKPSAPASDVVLARTDMSELLPRPTPMSLSLIEAMWASGGSIDLAARSIGAGYAVDEDARPYHVTAFGRLYVDRREETSRALRFPGLVRRRLERNAKSVEARFRDTFLPEHRQRMVPLEAADWEAPALPDLLDAITRVTDALLHDTRVEVDVVNIAAWCFIDATRKALEKAGLEPTAILADIPSTSLSLALAATREVPVEARRQSILACVGHRAMIDYELSNPRFREDASGLDAFLAAAMPTRGTGDANAAASADPGAASTLPAALAEKRALAAAVERARRFQTLKEDAKDAVLREIAVLRRMLLAVDKRLELGGAIFDLTIDEIPRLGGPDLASLVEVAKRRKASRERLLQEPALGRELTISDLERGPLAQADAAAAPGPLQGTRVAGGSTAVEGHAFVVSADDAERGLPLAGFARGDIIVSPLIHPAWLPQVLQAAAVVSELGGWLSHMAIVAREHGVPMVVGVSNLASITSGTMLRVEGNGRIVELEAAAPNVIKVAAE